MRYYLRGDTLFIRGSFRVASSGILGGIGLAHTIVMHTLQDKESQDPGRAIENAIAREGLPNDYFGLPTLFSLHHLCILQYDFITVFVLADIMQGSTILVSSGEGFEDGALIGAVATAAEARGLASQAAANTASAATGDAILVGGEGDPVHSSAGSATEPGRRIREAVFYGITEALKRSAGIEQREAPSFFMFSRYGGDHWIEWQAETCPYYPCHFTGQRCDFCYCPLYPCGDESLGQEMRSSSKNGMVWNCAGCTLLHEEEIAEYLKKYPEASLRELKSLKKRLAGKDS